jgi:hypothetical protein
MQSVVRSFIKSSSAACTAHSESLQKLLLAVDKELTGKYAWQALEMPHW